MQIVLSHCTEVSDPSACLTSFLCLANRPGFLLHEPIVKQIIFFSLHWSFRSFGLSYFFSLLGQSARLLITWADFSANLFYLIALKFLILRLVLLLCDLFFAWPSARLLITWADCSANFFSHCTSPMVMQIYFSHYTEVLDPSACPTSFLCDLFFALPSAQLLIMFRRWFCKFIYLIAWKFQILRLCPLPFFVICFFACLSAHSHYTSPIVKQIYFSHCNEVLDPSACPTSFLYHRSDFLLQFADYSANYFLSLHWSFRSFGLSYFFSLWSIFCLPIGQLYLMALSRLFCKFIYLIASKFQILRLYPLLFDVICFFACPSAPNLIMWADSYANLSFTLPISFRSFGLSYFFSVWSFSLLGHRPTPFDRSI